MGVGDDQGAHSPESRASETLDIQANFQPDRCSVLEANYLKYEALATMYMNRYRAYNDYRDYMMGEEYEERRIQTAQIIMTGC